MRNCCHSCKFFTLAVICQKWDRGKSFYVENRLCSALQKRCEYFLKTSWKQVNKNSTTWWYVLKASWRDLCKTSWRCLDNVLKTSSKLLEDVLKMLSRRFCKRSWRRFKDILKTSWQDVSERHVEVMKTSWRRMTKTNISVWIKTTWRSLEDIFWRHMSKANIFILIKTSWRRLENVLWRRRRKTSSSRQMFAGKKTIVFIT